MMKFFNTILLFALFSLLISCAGGGGGSSVGVYHHHHGHGPWWGYGPYYRDTVIVTEPVPDIAPAVEATPLPSEPEQMPDMGSPMLDMGEPMPEMGMPDML